jgi:mono/diheme cytochrome c family protein
MNLRSLIFILLGAAACCSSLGCRSAPGKPRLDAESARPEQVLDFPALYKQNCAACHGADGNNGAAISLANPVYLLTAGMNNIGRITATGLPGTLMPGFARSAGGTLTDVQVKALVNGMFVAWGKTASLSGATPLPYASHTAGDPEHGRPAFVAFCAACHGASGSGVKDKTGSIVDPSYLALMSDQSLRSIILTGRPDLDMPDWRSDIKGADAHAMTDQQVTDVVAWLAAQRPADPQQTSPKQP